MADIKATSNTSNQPHDKMETENLYDPNDKFSINQFLSNSDLTPDSTAFLTEDLKKLQEPGLLLEDHDDDNDKSKELLRYVIRNQERLREQGEEAREEQTINRQEAQIARERQREEAIRRQQEETARASAQLERDMREDRQGRITTKVKPRAHFKEAHGDYDTVGSTVKHAWENPRDVGGDIVEAVVNKETRQFGGKVLRGEFAAAASQLGDDVVHKAEVTKNAVTGIGTGLLNAASNAKDVAVDTVSSVAKKAYNLLPSWGS